MAISERGSYLETLSNFPKTSQEAGQVPQLLLRTFAPHIEFIRESHKYWTGRKKIVTLSGTPHGRHDVERRDNTFSFYSESEDLQERRTVAVTMTKDFGRMERIEILNQAQDTKIHTLIDLQFGIKIEQSVEGEQTKHLFVFDPQAPELATLTFIMKSEEHRVLTITPSEEIIQGRMRRDMKTGRRSLEVPGGIFYLLSPDEFIQGAIRNILSLKPAVLLSSRS